MSASDTPYATLSPDCVLDAIDSTGQLSDGRLLALNSYENRVYQVGLDAGGFIVAKFYRAGRWSDAAILEEHAFALELTAAELPMVAPLVIDGQTLFTHQGFRFALYPRRGGRAPQLESRDNCEWMGRLIARMHQVGRRARFAHREAIDVDVFIDAPAQAVHDSGLLPPFLDSAYEQAVDRIDDGVEAAFARIEPFRGLRLHGDCHGGNVLWTDDGPHFVDLDDARSGPAIQDLWMLAQSEAAMDALLEGYAQFGDMDPAELALIPALRAMRQVHHAGWIAQRWADPAFPAAFPYAGEARWWQEHIDDLHRAADAL
ncbi:serine/threonine protein kinase [Oleiagrimonas sp. C23AA]|uniref:serine/threonine protein kinase n=1 Tax=Oleiagrimonas sp. C23AA TaxID=2719047 RepID=UPI0014227C58|nr:serine/threonine protein kinase [Oleiagrimonas sp. C23AA]NII12329.1 serine/threonine protein kinase [Oleiagrimonas sp. C23AA]